MNRLSPSIRKADILVSTLDDRAADALLEQMGDETAARVRSALVALEESPAEEQQAVAPRAPSDARVKARVTHLRAPRAAQSRNDPRATTDAR